MTAGHYTLQQGDLNKAERYFRVTVEGLSQEDANPVEMAIFSLYLAKTLLLNRKSDEVCDIAEKMLLLLRPLRTNQVACGAILEFLNAHWAGTVTVTIIDQTIAKLQEGGHREGARTTKSV